MKTQHIPLYAMDQAGAFYQVIGWAPATNGRVLPMIVPLSAFGRPQAWQDPLVYLPDAPNVDHELSQLQAHSVQRDEAKTEVIQRVPNYADGRPVF